MLLSLDYKKVFISIPKCASTSIMYSLNKNSLDYPPQIYHASAKELPALIKKMPISDLKNNLYDSKKWISSNSKLSLKDFNYYACLRDPFERVRSIWLDFRRIPCDDSLKKIVSIDDFQDYIEYILDHDLYDLPRHFWPYNFFIKGVNSKNLHIFKIGDANQCFYKLIEHRLFSKFLYRILLSKFRSNASLINDNQKIEGKVELSFKKKYKDDYDLYNLIK